VARPSRAPHPLSSVRYGVFAAWLPDLETEAASFVLRFRGPRAAAAYRHAVACINGQVARDAPVRVAVRDVQTDAPALLLALRLDGNETIAELIEGS
jgi:hypothetical protein